MEDVLVGALDDPVGVLASTQVRAADAERRDAIVPALVLQVLDVPAEAGRAAAESHVPEHRDLGASEDPEGRDAVVHVVWHLAEAVAHTGAEVVAVEIRILEEAHALSGERSASPLLGTGDGRCRDHGQARHQNKRRVAMHVKPPRLVNLSRSKKSARREGRRARTRRQAAREGRLPITRLPDYPITQSEVEREVNPHEPRCVDRRRVPPRAALRGVADAVLVCVLKPVG